MAEIFSECGIRIACENNYVIYTLVLSPDCDVKIKNIPKKVCPKTSMSNASMPKTSAFNTSVQKCLPLGCHGY